MEDYYYGSSDDEYCDRVCDDDDDGEDSDGLQEPEVETDFSLYGKGPSCKVQESISFFLIFPWLMYKNWVFNLFYKVLGSY